LVRKRLVKVTTWLCWLVTTPIPFLGFWPGFTTLHSIPWVGETGWHRGNTPIGGHGVPSGFWNKPLVGGKGKSGGNPQKRGKMGAQLVNTGRGEKFWGTPQH